MKNFFLILIVVIITSVTPKLVNASEAFVRVNFTTATLTVDTNNGERLLSTPVVLPRGNYYRVPVDGTLQRAVLGPRWTPTANMHRDYPGRYKQSYGPYESGNAMGHCKLYINFNSSNPIMNVVRIHGNARNEDLGKRVSRSCVRIPDALCPKLVELTQAFATVHIEFVR